MLLAGGSVIWSSLLASETAGCRVIKSPSLDGRGVVFLGDDCRCRITISDDTRRATPPSKFAGPTAQACQIPCKMTLQACFQLKGSDEAVQGDIGVVIVSLFLI